VDKNLLHPEMHEIKKNQYGLGDGKSENSHRIGRSGKNGRYEDRHHRQNDKIYPDDDIRWTVRLASSHMSSGVFIQRKSEIFLFPIYPR
jgi:hypothetical protein